MSSSSTSGRRTAIVLLAVALLVAGVLSYFASTQPDGLERAAEDHGIADTAREHDLTDSPFADYATKGVDNDWLSGAIAGVAGVLLVAAIAGGLFWVLRSRREAGERAASAATDD